VCLLFAWALYSVFKMCIVIHCARGCSSALFMSNCINLRSFVYTGRTGTRVSYDTCIVFRVRYCFCLIQVWRNVFCVICLYIRCMWWIYKDWTRLSVVAKWIAGLHYRSLAPPIKIDWVGLFWRQIFGGGNRVVFTVGMYRWKIVCHIRPSLRNKRWTRPSVYGPLSAAKPFVGYHEFWNMYRNFLKQGIVE
jgi:hypothetical protein